MTLGFAKITVFRSTFDVTGVIRKKEGSSSLEIEVTSLPLPDGVEVRAIIFDLRDSSQITELETIAKTQQQELANIANSLTTQNTIASSALDALDAPQNVSALVPTSNGSHGQ